MMPAGAPVEGLGVDSVLVEEIGLACPVSRCGVRAEHWKRHQRRGLGEHGGNKNWA